MLENVYTKKCIKCSTHYDSVGKRFGLCATCAGDRIRELHAENKQLIEKANRCDELEKENTEIKEYLNYRIKYQDDLLTHMADLIKENEQLKSDAELGIQLREYNIEGWWCPNCKELLDGSRVTYQERCDTCGHGVSWIDQKED